MALGGVHVDREWIGARASVTFTFLVAVLSVATGIANISAAPSGPLVQYVPELVQQTVGFTGALTGFLMLGSAFGLRSGLRSAWVSTIVLLPVTAAQGLLQASVYSYPLVALSAISLPVILLNHGRFTRELDLTATQLAAIVSLVGAQLYGTAGTYALREEFNGVQSLTDAYWYTIVTGSTVGYGDITPASDRASLFAISVLLVNVAAFAVALGVLLTPAIEARLSKALGKMNESQLDLLDDHILVLGYGELTEPILEELDEKTQFLIVTPESERARTLSERGYSVLTGDPSDEEMLEKAKISLARAVVVATNEDAQDALAILTARQLNPEIRIVAAATHRENVNKMKRAGADTVISPTTIGGHLLVESALGGEDSEAIADRILGEDDERNRQR
ncbi:voltage-gated potassium channel [Halogranum rubrum]|uniref:Voltage-gated potassium channel n=1 Tax=Halogranum rubrum TaxID=553466 RepID=A0A1I4C2H1_9EURY|nr:NAD-binding protein [Halogranum rubrum]SFK75115.1 voltage-gated potassium channel [Halogranum rubrum]